MGTFKRWLEEAHSYKLGDKVVYQGETHVVRKLLDDDRLGIRKARTQSFSANPLKGVHHSLVNPYTPPVKPDKSGSDYGTCQVCGAKHKVRNGKVAHHGYQRPGYGYQTDSCDGARCEPFEVSRDMLHKHMEMVKDESKRHHERLRELTSSSPTLYRMMRKSFAHQPELKTIEPGHPNYHEHKDHEIQEKRARISLLTGHLEHQQKRFNEWKPKT